MTKREKLAVLKLAKVLFEKEFANIPCFHPEIYRIKKKLWAEQVRNVDSFIKEVSEGA